MLRIFHYLVLSLFLIALGWSCLSVSPKEDAISYNEHIRPILNQKCLGCHGGVKKQGGFSLLFESEAYAETESGQVAIVPGDHTASEMYRRITHQDPDMRMPPEGNPLTKEETDLIASWIDQGAEWEDHWAFVPISEAPAVPDVEDEGWGRNGIDAFVWKKLQTAGFEPAPTADSATLLRRVYLDLIGLPPTLEESEAFFQDKAPGAYERLVDRLLASPHYGEHWTAMWLDLARYGDSQGYQKDLLRRHIWRYRDWVIDAFNRDLPYDQFTIEQLAGDLLEDPSENQLLATAFHRNTNTNTEGGTDDEEFRTVAVIDRLNTTYEVWQGITMSCVQCHSHPYDPIRQREFYTSMAFFNNTMDADRGDEFPRKTLYSPGQRQRLAAYRDSLELLKSAGDTVSDTYARLVDHLTNIKPGPVPVMQDFPANDSLRPTFVFERGNWLVHGDRVDPDVPGSLPSMSTEAPDNRLGFAEWLVSPQNPLTARVTVNRFWAQLFGLGIVETLEDFGSQGAKPSHPELLDWLAWRFMHDHHWSVKSLLREIVLSSTYRQSAQTTPAKQEADPYNKLLSRGPRFRLSAEQLRDQALTVSGLLSRKMYGPSVMPYQPPGVWNVIRHTARWETSADGDQYRRGVYTFWRKTSPYPSMVAFDRPSGEICVSRRIRTNTPLQAMVTMNDPVFVEAAIALARTMLDQGGESPDDQIAYGFRRALFRTIDPYRAEAMLELYQKSLEHYQEQPAEAGRFVNDPAASPELAAMSTVANVLLNLDEFLVKN